MQNSEWAAKVHFCFWFSQPFEFSMVFVLQRLQTYSSQHLFVKRGELSKDYNMRVWLDLYTLVLLLKWHKILAFMFFCWTRCLCQCVTAGHYFHLFTQPNSAFNALQWIAFHPFCNVRPSLKLEVNLIWETCKILREGAFSPLWASQPFAKHLMLRAANLMFVKYMF